MNRDNEETEFLSFDNEERDFMLNDIPIKEEPLIEIDDFVDTKEEKDLDDSVELYELIKEVKKEEKPIKIIKKVKKEKKMKKDKHPKKRTFKKVLIFQTIFCALSIIIILGFSVYYGSKMLKYYKIYNPTSEDGTKAVLLGNSITGSAEIATEGNGLYRISGSYIYKGASVDNYVKYANTLWRIIKINSDGSIDMATNNYINALNWNSAITTYDKSDIRAYLNDVYLDTLDKSVLSQVTYCTDLVEDLSSVTCNSTNSDDYVRLLGINEFLNSEDGGSTFLAESNNYIWLYNSNEKNVWNTSGSGLGASNPNSGYLVKAVVHVKNSTQLISGSGTIDDPYIIEKEKESVKVGSYIKLGNDTWVTYEVNKDNIKLALSTVLSTTYKYSSADNTFNVSTRGSLAAYLNTTYLNSLSYKDLILDTVWNTGKYTSYKDVTALNVTSKVGLLNASDIKLNNIDTETNYYIMSSGDTYYEYMVGSALRQSKVTISRNIKPAISISLTSIVSGKGTKEDPYVLEG